MKRWLARKVGGFLDRSFERFAKKVVREYFFTELHPATLLFREAQAEAAAYVKERMPQALYFLDRLDLLRFAMDRISIPGMVLEFGVFKAGDELRMRALEVRVSITRFRPSHRSAFAQSLRARALPAPFPCRTRRDGARSLPA